MLNQAIQKLITFHDDPHVSEKLKEKFPGCKNYEESFISKHNLICRYLLYVESRIYTTKSSTLITRINELLGTYTYESDVIDGDDVENAKYISGKINDKIDQSCAQIINGIIDIVLVNIHSVELNTDSMNEILNFIKNSNEYKTDSIRTYIRARIYTKIKDVHKSIVESNIELKKNEKACEENISDGDIEQITNSAEKAKAIKKNVANTNNLNKTNEKITILYDNLRKFKDMKNHIIDYVIVYLFLYPLSPSYNSKPKFKFDCSPVDVGVNSYSLFIASLDIDVEGEGVEDCGDVENGGEGGDIENGKDDDDDEILVVTNEGGEGEEGEDVTIPKPNENGLFLTTQEIFGTLTGTERAEVAIKAPVEEVPMEASVEASVEKIETKIIEHVSTIKSPSLPKQVTKTSRKNIIMGVVLGGCALGLITYLTSRDSARKKSAKLKKSYKRSNKRSNKHITSRTSRY